MHKKKISKLILDKSPSYLNISITMLIVSLLLTFTMTILVLSEFTQVEKTFIENENVRMIIVDGKKDNKGLSYGDHNKIKAIIDKDFKGLNYKIINKYIYNGNAWDADNNEYFLMSLDKEANSFFEGESVIEENVLYTQIEIKPQIELEMIGRITNTDVNDESSEEYEEINFTIKNEVIDFEKNPFFINFNNAINNYSYLSFNTFSSIMEEVHGATWDELTSDDSIQADFYVGETYLYIEEIRHGEAVARVLDKNEFLTNYIFKSFDDVSKSMKTTIIIAIVIILSLLIATILNFILSLDSYLKVQQKDMGILKHHGYNDQKIKQIYSNNIKKIFLKISVTMLFI